MKVNVFIGNNLFKTAAQFETKKLVSSEVQIVKLFHKRSGGGCWAFYLKGFKSTKGEIEQYGYFITHRRYIRSIKWILNLNKKSLKYLTKGKINKRKEIK